MWRRYCCLTIFFPIVDTCLSCEDMARQSCAMVPRWRIFDDFFACGLCKKYLYVKHLEPLVVLRIGYVLHVDADEHELTETCVTFQRYDAASKLNNAP